MRTQSRKLRDWLPRRLGWMRQLCDDVVHAKTRCLLIPRDVDVLDLRKRIVQRRMHLVVCVVCVHQRELDCRASVGEMQRIEDGVCAGYVTLECEDVEEEGEDEAGE